MKKMKQLVGTIAVLAVAPSAFAAKHMHSGYVGVDVTQTNQSFKAGVGKDIFKKNAQEYGIFGGFKFAKHFGVEAGWEQQAKKKRSATNTVATLDEFNITQPGSFSYNSEVKGRHPYLGLFGECKHKSWSFQAMFGASFSKVKVKLTSLSTTGTVPTMLTAGNVVTGSKSRVVPMVKLSAMHNFTKNFGVRVSGMYRNTSGVKIRLDQDTTGNVRLKMKDTFGIGLGLVYSFK